MDRNSIIGFVLIAAILGAYTWYTMPSPEEQARQQQVQDSLANVEIERQAREAEEALKAQATTTGNSGSVAPATNDSILVVNGDTLNADSVRRALQGQRYGIFQAASTGSAQEVVIEHEVLHAPTQ